MRINFEWEWEIGDFFRGVKKKYLETICYFRGHIWEEYKESKEDGRMQYILNRYYQSAMLYGSGFGRVGWNEPEKIHTYTCKRCGEWKYKTIKRQAKNCYFV